MILACLFCMTGLLTLAQAVPEYMYYKFDATGNQQNFASAPVGNNPATLTGQTVGSTGQFGTALEGNGATSTSNRLNTGWATNLPSTGWTISFWLNNFPATSSTTFYYFGDNTAQSFRCFTGGVAGNGNLLIRGTGLTDCPINNISPGPIVIHVVYTGLEMKVYKNGVFSNSVTESAAVTLSGAGPFLVGGYSSSNSINTGTLMDEFRLYNRVLTDTEIAATWNQQLPLVTGPVVVTTAATSVTGVGATLNGTVNANNASTTVTFEYGLTTSYGTVVPGVPGTVTGNSVTPVSAAISGLTPNTTYHYRAVGVNTNGTGNGNDMTFTTAAFPPPTAVTTAASAILLNGATLNGTMNANGASTAVTFEYGPTTTYGTVVAGVPSPVTGTTATAVSAAITGLAANSTYHYRILGTSVGGNATGNDMTFATAGPPSAVTTAATSILATSAVLNGTVTANNLSSTVTFQWGVTTSYGNTVTAVPSPVSGNTPTAVNYSLAGLTSGTTYHYRCVATNAQGTSNGADMFFTPGCPLITAPPTITGPTSVCAGTASVVYSIAPLANTTGYTWTVPAGATITAGANTTSITVTFGSTSGAVTVCGTSSCMTGPVTSVNVTVNPIPVPTITGTGTLCQGSAPVVYTTQPGMSNYTWTVSAGGVITAGGTPTSNTVTVNWTGPGAQSVSVNYSATGGCFAAAPVSYPVTVNPTPVPYIGSSNNPCIGATNNMYYTEAGMNNYVWTVSSGGTIAAGQGTSVLNVTWNQQGVQYVTVTYTNSFGCAAVAPTMTTQFVNAPPSAAASITGTTPVCAGTSAVAFSSTPVSGAETYTWTVPAGATIASGAGTTSITVDFGTTAVTGNVTVAGTNQCGNGPVSSFAVTVKPLPAAAGTITGQASVCAGATGVTYTVPAITGATSYMWTVPGGATITSDSTTNTIAVTFGTSAGAGVINVKGSNSCGTGAASPDFSVTVHAVPSAPVITANGNVLTSSSATGNQWYYEGTAIAGATGQTYTVTGNTGYYWCVVTLNGCASPISNKEWVVITGQQEIAQPGVTIYPVPNDGKFTVTLTAPVQTVFRLSVFSQLGIRVMDIGDIPVNGRVEVPVDLSSAAAGLYTVAILTNDHKMVRKVLISK